MVMYLQQGANDLHVAQMMTLPPPLSLAPVKSSMVYLSGAGIPMLSRKTGH